MDTAYGRLGLPVPPGAVSSQATVISVDRPSATPSPTPGLKAFGMDHGEPTVEGHDLFFTSDEHATFTWSDATRRPTAVGDRVRMLPAHVDPTVAYHERMWVIDATDPTAAARSSTPGRSTSGTGESGSAESTDALGDRRSTRCATRVAPGLPPRSRPPPRRRSAVGATAVGDQRDHASAEPTAGEPRAVRARRDQLRRPAGRARASTTPKSSRDERWLSTIRRRRPRRHRPPARRRTATTRSISSTT